MPKFEKSARVPANRGFRRIALAIAAAATMLGGIAVAAVPARADAPRYVTLLICSDVPGVTFAVAYGINQSGIAAPYKTWQLNQTWEGFEGQNWQCSWTATNVIWLWSTARVFNTQVEFGPVSDNPLSDVDTMDAFQGTSGWYDDTGTYYACFITSQDQQSC